MYIDAVVVLGETKGFSCSIQVNTNASNFVPLDLNNYAVQFRVMGAPTADAEVLVEHIITQNTDIETQGQINNPANGEFTFVITAEDTVKLGIGNHPIQLRLLNAEDLEPEYTLTEGGEKGEFSKLQIVQV